jgi:hypothetical protein
MAPTAKSCTIPGSNLGEDGGVFRTDPDCRSREEVKVGMREHTRVYEVYTNQIVATNKTTGLAQVLVIQQGGAGDGGEDHPKRSRPAKLERHPMEQGVTESEWQMLVADWDCYKHQLIHHL